MHSRSPGPVPRPGWNRATTLPAFCRENHQIAKGSNPSRTFTETRCTYSPGRSRVGRIDRWRRVAKWLDRRVARPGGPRLRHGPLAASDGDRLERHREPDRGPTPIQEYSRYHQGVRPRLDVEEQVEVRELGADPA